MRKSSCSFIIFLLGVATFAFNPSIVQAAVIDASVAAEVKTGEVDDDLRYVNAQGSGNGNFTSYGVLQFDTTSLAGTSSIDSVALSLSQSNAFADINYEYDDLLDVKSIVSLASWSAPVWG